MLNQELSRQLQRLNDLFDKTDAACGNDFEMRSQWAKYLCVLSAGFLENALKEIYGDFVLRAASKPVANYVISTLSRVQNPKTSKFIEIARSFKLEWGANLELFVDSNGRREAVDSLMSNRHLVAHGKYSGVTIAQVREYLNKSVEIIDYIEAQCLS